jgi:hypothetical protein
MTLERRLFLRIQAAGEIRVTDLKGNGFSGIQRSNTLKRLLRKGLVVRAGSGPWTWTYRLVPGAQAPEDMTGIAPGSIANLLRYNYAKRTYRSKSKARLPDLSWSALL